MSLMTFEKIIDQFIYKKPEPIYFLYGEEPFYIDEIAINSKQLLEEHERDFNQFVFYGKDVDTVELAGQLKQYPVMSEFQLIILKEAQHLNNWDNLTAYFNNPISSSILIICFKGKPDKRLNYWKAIQKSAILFESKLLYDQQIESWINNYLKTKQIAITPKACALLFEYLGNDLRKIANEINKMIPLLIQTDKITDKDIERNIGVSKDYNVFELSNALQQKDIISASKILSYFDQNPKAGPVPVLISSLFKLFENLLRIHFLNTTNVNTIQSELRLNYYSANNLLKAKSKYGPKKIAKNISLIHEYDLKLKGLNRGTGSDYNVLKELIFQLIH